MSPPRRRSRRLRGSNMSPAKSSNTISSRLGSLAERDETPTHGPQSTLDAIVSSPLAPRTPATAGCAKPSLEEMHPSKAHQSTTKGPDSGLRFGFVDIDAKGENQHSGVAQQTPSKLGISSPSFDFRFARPGPQLGPEAQRMMDELREEALRIKAKLAAEREEEIRNAGESSNVNMEGRKIAQPKGKVGRFSDIHMAEFKRMDSIAGHPSSFRAQPGRMPPTTNSLKRTQSKAKLDERDEIHTERSLHKSVGRLENTAPAKRARQNITDDISSTRPASRDGAQQFTPRQRNMPSSITTPTQVTLARSATAKHPGTSIPTLSRSPSKPNLVGTPRTLPKSATVNNLSSLPRSTSKVIFRSPGKFDRVKSILRHTSLSTKKPAAIPSLTRSPSKPNLEKALPSIPTTPGRLEQSDCVKRVNFTPSTTNQHAATVQNTPSPLKSGIPRSTSKINLGKPHSARHLTNKVVQYPRVDNHPSLAAPPQTVEYPSLPNIPPLPEPSRESEHLSRPPPSVPSTFTFRSNHTIDFGASPKGFGSSPGQASVRQVRPSIMPDVMPGSFPGANKENSEPLPLISHGTSNKKRRRVDSDEDREDDFERSPKKYKKDVPEGAMLMDPRILTEQVAPKSKIPSPAKKKGLSLSRLNMLARPKMRK